MTSLRSRLFTTAEIDTTEKGGLCLYLEIKLRNSDSSTLVLSTLNTSVQMTKAMQQEMHEESRVILIYCSIRCIHLFSHDCTKVIVSI